MPIGSGSQTTRACGGFHIRVTGSVNARGAQLNRRPNKTQAQAWAPGFDTLKLATTLQLKTQNKAEDLTREIVVSMLLGPVAFEFPSLDEMESAERPEDCWVYDEDYGFVIRPGVSIITAMARATQPSCINCKRYEPRGPSSWGSSMTCFCVSKAPGTAPCRHAILCRGTKPGFATRMKRRQMPGAVPLASRTLPRQRG